METGPLGVFKQVLKCAGTRRIILSALHMSQMDFSCFGYSGKRKHARREQLLTKIYQLQSQLVRWI